MMSFEHKWRQRKDFKKNENDTVPEKPLFCFVVSTVGYPAKKAEMFLSWFKLDVPRVQYKEKKPWNSQNNVTIIGIQYCTLYCVQVPYRYLFMDLSLMYRVYSTRRKNRELVKIMLPLLEYNTVRCTAYRYRTGTYLWYAAFAH